MDYNFFMGEALLMAYAAMADGETPVGAVIVYDGEIIGRGRNRRERDASSIAHAEIEAIGQANKARGQWRLCGCSIFVTLEPCPMCAGAIINARLDRVYFGASDPKGGACGSVINLFEEQFNHRPRLYGGIMGQKCGEILSEFFRSLPRH